MSKPRRVAYLITALVGFVAGALRPDAADAWGRAANGFIEGAVFLAAFWLFGIGAWHVAGWSMTRWRRPIASGPPVDRSAMDRRAFLRFLWPARTK